jgi:hypothetical protein
LIVKVTTELPIPAETACELAQKPAMFKHVVWPVFTIGEVPARIEEGEEVSARLYFFGLLPAWKHHLRLVSLKEREIYSNEHGGPVAVWNHRLTFEPVSERSCRYTDEVEIHAGVSTLPTVLFAHLVYRWRQRRWRTLARVLA